MVLGFFNFHVALALFVITVLLQIWDIWSTNRFLTQDSGHETNGFMLKMFSLVGFWPAMIIKFVVSVGLAGALTFVYGFWPPMLLWIFFYIVFSVVANSDLL